MDSVDHSQFSDKVTQEDTNFIMFAFYKVLLKEILTTSLGHKNAYREDSVPLQHLQFHHPNH